jgi:hypothetical protein
MQALLAVAGTQQRQFESRISGRIGRQRTRGHRANQPSRFRRAGAKCRCDTGDQHQCSRSLCGQCKTPACREIIRLCFAPYLDQYRAEHRTARARKPGLKRRWHISGRDEYHPCRIATELHQARRPRPSCLGNEIILAHPEDRPPAVVQASQTQHETCKRNAVSCRISIKFMAVCVRNF